MSLEGFFFVYVREFRYRSFSLYFEVSWGLEEFSCFFVFGGRDRLGDTEEF